MNTEKPAILYHICLRGKLDPEFSLWFPELTLTEDPDRNTMLHGELADQSALLGILFRAHNLNLHILSVNHE